ncbi:MAG: flagellar protein FliS [Acidobacteriia bacterium]|nr:flagellar protein FliS [Terriglobia bacterium]
MTRTQTERTYLATAVQNATSAGLVVILFDLLISDLNGAIAAIERNQAEELAAKIKHAFLVLQQLDGSLDMERGGQAAKHFSSFYAAIRCKVLEGQIKQSSEILRRQIELLFEVRQAWQQVDQPNLGMKTEPQSAAAAPAARFTTSDQEVTTTNWTA